ncbi:MAG: two-component regulator propeller domain-containing protein [Bacteroidia bacterium]
MTIIFFSSCSGQTTGEQRSEAFVEQLSFTSKNVKLTKTQGTTEHQNVHCSLQDKDGNLWFGTSGEGVYRYDGNVFTQFTEKDGLSNNSIWSILEDKSGNIWFGTDDGVCRYNGKTISKIPFTTSNASGIGTSLQQLLKNSVWSMMQDKSGIIWFGTTQDLYCYNGKSFSRFLDNDNISNNQNLQLKWIQCFLEDCNGIIWMGSGPIASEGVIQFDGKMIKSSKPNGDGWIRYMVEDKIGQIWFGGRNHGNFIFKDKGFTNYTQKTGIGNPVLVDKSGKVWFSGEERTGTIDSEGGIWCYDGKTFENFSTQKGLGKYSVWSMLEDRNGNIWIGTRNCGLYRYNGQTFQSFSE